MAEHVQTGLQIQQQDVAVLVGDLGVLQTGGLVAGDNTSRGNHLEGSGGQAVLTGHDLDGTGNGRSVDVGVNGLVELLVANLVDVLALSAVVQSVQGHNGQLVTGQSSVGLGLGGQVLKQLDGLGSSHDGHGPGALAGVDLQSVDEHGGGLSGGHGIAGTEGAVAVAGDNAQVHAEVHIALSPAALERSGVRELAGALEGIGVDLRAIHHLGDDGGHLSTGNSAGGIEVAVGANEQAQTSGDGSSFLVDDLVSIVESCAGADDHHAEQHNGSQSQAKNALDVSHGYFLL